MKGSVKVKGTLLTIAEKLVLDDELACHTVTFSDHLVKIRRDGVADPVEDDVVH
jgi:hypothetical protein